MKQIRLSILIVVLLCMLTNGLFAHDIEVQNADGVTIYYNYINEGAELEVTRHGAALPRKYSGKVVIPEEVNYNNKTYKVTSIGYHAFWNCSGLTSITIPNSVANIGEEAFFDCSKCSVHITDIAAWCKIKFVDFYSNPLYYAKHIFMDGKEITDLVIPNGVTSIGDYAFNQCSGLTSVTIPNSVTSIGEGAFSGCSGLTSVTIGNGVTSIGEYAFLKCSGLTSIEIPNSVTSIENIAFGNCSGLTSITIPNSVTNIGNNAFGGCSGLTKVTLNSNAIASKSYNLSSTLGSIFGNQVKVYVLGDNVTSIGNYAFGYCSALTSITIPNSVTSIGESAFRYCSGLTSITIPNNVTSIGDKAFSNCSGLTSVTIPNNVTSIGDYAFSDCSGLTSVTIDSNTILSKTYTYDSNFKNIFGYQVKKYIIGSSVTSIGEWAFGSCSRLASVTIPNSVTRIGKRAFCGCSGLSSITIPNSVTSIGAGAFRGCSDLSSIIIPNSVTNIENDAFNDCDNLANVVSLIENPFKISYSVFSKNTYLNGTLYVLRGTINKYKKTEGWKDFVYMEEGTPIGITSVTSDKETLNAPIYDLNGRRLTEPQKGINIIGGKKVLNH